MPETTEYFCVDRIVSPEDGWLANQKAIEENPENRSPFEATLLRSRRWRPGRTLHVAFLEGPPILQQKVASYAQQWCQYANITFLFDHHPEAEIRITFQPGKTGTWSDIGTDALHIPTDQPTMNYSQLTADSPDEAFSYYVLHEFGHVLGLLHEHQSPEVDIQWNKAAVKKYYAGYSDLWLETNIFTRYKRSQTRSSTFDPYSIMLYHIPKELTLNGFETQINTTLSKADKRFIQQWYS
jgi:serralysin